jgi:hypothetical protein
VCKIVCKFALSETGKKVLCVLEITMLEIGFPKKDKVTEYVKCYRREGSTFLLIV